MQREPASPPTKADRGRQRHWRQLPLSNAARSGPSPAMVARDTAGRRAPAARSPRSARRRPLSLRNSPTNTRSAALRVGRHRHEFGIGDAIVHDAHQRARFADLGGEGVAAVLRSRTETGRCAARSSAFGGQVEKSCRRGPAIVQAAAMRRVDAHGACSRVRKPRIGATFGAVAMHDVRARYRRRAERHGGWPPSRWRRSVGSSACG